VISLPLWATALIDLTVKVVTQWLANLRAEQALRDLGAKTQAVDSVRQAEVQESAARAAGEAAQDAEDDSQDLRD
jgi:cysteine synthase